MNLSFLILVYPRWDKQLTPVPATFTFAILNSYQEKAFVVDVNERKMFGHAPGNSKVAILKIKVPAI